jgi:MFS transporter, putative metabolite:H+ symporter
VIEASSAPALIARLERAPFSRWHLRARIVMGSATFFDAFDALSLAFVLPVLVRLWGITPVQIGWLISVGYLGQFVGALVFGAMAERYGRIRSAAGATALMSVMSLACALAGSFPTLLMLRLVQGIGVGGEMPVAAVYINELSKAKGRGRFFLLYEMIFPVGLMMTGQIGAVVVPTLGWQVMFLIGAIPGLVIAALLLRLRESPRWLIGKGRLEEAEAIIREIEASAPQAFETTTDTTITNDIREQAEGRDRRGRRGSELHASATRWSELLSALYVRRTLVVWVLWACAYFITNGLNNWMPTLYNRVYGLSLDQALRAGTLTNVAQVAILLGCAFAIDRLGRRGWTMVCFVAGAVLLAALGSFASGSVVAVITLVTLSYGIVGSVNAVLYLYTPEIYPTRIRALGTGAATCWLRLASAAGPVLVGYLVAHSGTGAVFLMFAAAGAVGAVAATAMLETRNRRLEEIAP